MITIYRTFLFSFTVFVLLICEVYRKTNNKIEKLRINVSKAGVSNFDFQSPESKRSSIRSDVSDYQPFRRNNFQYTNYRRYMYCFDPVQARYLHFYKSRTKTQRIFFKTRLDSSDLFFSCKTHKTIFFRNTVVIEITLFYFLKTVFKF